MLSAQICIETLPRVGSIAKAGEESSLKPTNRVGRREQIGSYVMAGRCAPRAFPNDTDACARATRPLRQIKEVIDRPEMRSHVFTDDDVRVDAVGNRALCAVFQVSCGRVFASTEMAAPMRFGILLSGGVKGPWCRPVGRAA
jgi:hypothetical protein